MVLKFRKSPERDAAEVRKALELLQVIEDGKRQNRLKYESWEEGQALYPYPWQMDFYDAGLDHPERALIAANRVGKTMACAKEIAIHAMGMYSPWWNGRRFETPVQIWVGSDTNENSRDIVQRALLGRIDEENKPDGSGWIAKNRIGKVKFRQCGVSGVVDTVEVQSDFGGWSEIAFKTYEQGRAKWMGTSKHIIWLDEEPPNEIFTEAMTRLIDKKGIMIFSATPMEGMSEVIMHFLNGGPGIYVKNATWDDAIHLDPAERERYLLSYPEHERAARTKGDPMMGSGVVYPIPDDEIICDPIVIPDYYRRIVGLDFGFDHPTAAVWLAYDPDADIVYVTDAYKGRRQPVAIHAQAIRSRGERIPVAWPHDGMQHDKSGSGGTLSEMYREHQVNMMAQSARYQDDKGGGQPKEPAIQDIYERMMTGRFRVFSNLSDWLHEKRIFHRKDGKIVAEREDLMMATNYGMMMLRYAQSEYEFTEGSSGMIDMSTYNPLASGVY